MPNKDQIFEVFVEVARSRCTARDLELRDVQAMLQVVSDTLIREYSLFVDDFEQEILDLSWDEDNWPAKASILLEMKRMILELENKDRENTGLKD